MALDKYQADVLSYLFTVLPIAEEVDSLEFGLKGEFTGKFAAMSAPIQTSGAVGSIVFTLPKYSRSVFIGLTEGPASDVALILANLEDHERASGEQLGLGEAVQIKASASGETPFAILLLRTATSVDCNRVEDRKDIAGRYTSFFLAVPLTLEEWELRNTAGHDALIDRFISSQKDIFFSR